MTNITLQGKLPKKLYVACSGGVDSMAVVAFLSKKHDVHLLFFDHGTETSAQALNFLKERFPIDHLTVGQISREKRKTESQEEFWRNERYAFLKTFVDAPVITCHHLDDCVETWIWSSLHGKGKIIPYAHCNVIRPFLLNKKSTLVDYCIQHNVEWIEDKSNHDVKYMRNLIRHELMPKIQVVNPGIHKVIAKKVREQGYE